MSGRRLRSNSGIAQLWQLPLLIVSLGLFGYAAWLFIDPQPGPTIEEQVTAARNLLTQERPDAAVPILNRLLNTQKLTPPQQGIIHLMLSESIDQRQKQLRVSI